VGYKAQTLKRLIEIIKSLLILIRQRAKLGGTLLESRGYIAGKLGGTLMEKFLLHWGKGRGDQNKYPSYNPSAGRQL